MYKIVGLFLTLLLLSGCNNPAAENSSEKMQSPLPNSAVPSAVPSDATSVIPLDSPLPTASAEQISVPLDENKLQANFGFADDEGKRVLVTGHEEGEQAMMELLDLAIGENGSVHSVKFEKWQEGNEQNNGRDTAQNIPNLPGFLFTVHEGNAVPDETYYLASRAYFDPNILLTIQPTNEDNVSTEVDANVKNTIAAAQNRDIEEIWKLADLSGKGEIYLVQFVKQDKNMLFSIVLKEGEQLTFQNYPAVTQNEYSVWRVDDGGKINPDLFSILFAAEASKGIVIGLNWLGAEGVNSFLLEQVGDTFSEIDIEYNRYTSPL